ncbi:MAG TPA: hypothetical protein VM557_02095 [Thermoanaerobaculia bacterium]|nr:hypothetical protein [Thermoanaerobaculia bacterium]
MRPIQRPLLSLLFTLFAVASSAAVYVVPPDDDLIERADRIVVAVLESSVSYLDERGAIVTDHRFVVEDVLKGEAAARVTVTVPGGQVAKRGLFFSAAPVYRDGERVLLFLSGRELLDFQLGSFSFVEDTSGRELLVRGSSEREIRGWDPLRGRHLEKRRDARAFIASIREAARGGELHEDYFVEAALPDTGSVTARSHRSGTDYLFAGVWPSGAFTFLIEGATPCAGSPCLQDSIVTAAQVWNGAPATINIGGGGESNKPKPDVTAVPQQDGENTLFLDMPNSGYLSGSIVAYAWQFHNSGTPFGTALECDVWIEQGLSGIGFEEAVGHEMGHCLGLRHSNEGTPASNDALMYSIFPSGRGSTLLNWDKEAANHVYGDGSYCTPPSITSQPQSRTINEGESALLAVGATGENLSYQWRFNGAPINGATSSSFDTGPLPAGTFVYDVIVTDSCDSVTSSSATITVVARCDPPLITQQPQSQTVAPGESATLTVVANHVGSWQWFKGPAGDESSPISGATSSSYQTGPLTATQSFWVKLANACGSTASNTAVITVESTCFAPQITTQPQSLTIPFGESANLTVEATGSSLEFQWYRGAAPDVSNPVSGATTRGFSTGALTANSSFWVKVSNSCGSRESATAVITLSCGVPRLGAPGTVPSGLTYDVVWSQAALEGASYEIQESTTPDFSSGVITRTITGLSTSFTHTVTAATTYYYRVRVTNCNGSPGAFSTVATTVVVPPAAPESARFDLVAPLGTTQTLIQQVFVPSPGGTTTFTAAVDQPWLTVTPASGTIGPDGVTLTITANPAELPVGATTATLTVTFGAASGGKRALGGGTKNIPVSVTLVTPVSSGGKDSPASNSLLIPAVAHVAGGAFFQSDVRLGNLSSSTLDYELFFTPTLTNGLLNGKRTIIRLQSGQTAALNAIVKNFFGYAGPTDSVSGALEIRPLKTLVTTSFASSRTYATTTLGTLGQFIPGVPFPQFIGTPATVPGEPAPTPVRKISLQQLAQNGSYRTNIGLLEATGLGASGNILYYTPAGEVFHQTPFTLGPAEQRQLSAPLRDLGISIADARAEVVMDESSPGRVTAYASVIDNETSDPFLVAAARPDDVRSRRYILPGVAAVDNPGGSNFYSDVRVYNAGSAPASVTIRFVPLTGFTVGTGAVGQVTIQPGQVLGWDNALKAIFDLDLTAGALHFETPSDSSLIVTGRTFSRAAKGTYGQFIPALLPTEGAGLGEGSVEVFQLEQSANFRTNIGLIELTGKPVTIRITAVAPEARVTPSLELTLQANEFRQFNAFLRDVLNLGGNVYNGRISITVIGGEGRVAAYASVIDNRTSDPTYVPGQ